MIVMRRMLVTALAVLGAAGALPSTSAWSQAYPDRVIKLVVPFAAGGNADINGRIIGEVWHKALGQPVVVENRAGAGGGVGAEVVARAAPDGYTLLVASNGPMTINPFVNANVTYDPLADFAPIAMVSYVPHVLIVSNKLGLKSVSDLIALSKTRPVTLATSGFGSATHMTVERFKLATGAAITHVPYKSGGALLPDVITGNIDGAMTELSTAMELHKGGQALILAVAGAARSKLAPDIPTFDEQGVKGFQARSFIGIVAPGKTPADIIAKLQAAIAAGLAAGTDAAAKIAGTGSELATPEQRTAAGFAAFIKADFEEMRAAAKAAGIEKK
jgi:tripartite-type tricarboxylate transporter receptor subunit TctC